MLQDRVAGGVVLRVRIERQDVVLRRPFQICGEGGAAANARTRKSLFIVPPPLFKRKRFLDQRREKAGAKRDHLVVEIVVRIVEKTTPCRAALAEKNIGAGARCSM